MDVEVIITESRPVEVTGQTANVFILGELSEWWGFSSTDLIRVLKNGPELTNVNVYMNCIGGDLGVGLMLYDLFKGSSVTVTAYLLGKVASAATVAACGADRVIISEQCLYLIHKPMSGGSYLNAEEVRDIADTLDQWEAIMNNVYRKKTGLEEQVLTDLMARDIWINPQTALEMGFVDEVADSITIDWSNNTVGDWQFEYYTSVWNSDGDTTEDGKMIMTGQTSFSSGVLACVKNGHKSLVASEFVKPKIHNPMWKAFISLLVTAGFIKEEDQAEAVKAVAQGSEEFTAAMVKDLAPLVKAQIKAEQAEGEGGEGVTADDVLEAIQGMDDEQLDTIREALATDEGEEGEGATDTKVEDSEEFQALQKQMEEIQANMAKMKRLPNQPRNTKKPSNGKPDAGKGGEDEKVTNGTWKPAQLRSMLSGVASKQISEEDFKAATGLTVEEAKAKLEAA